MQPGDQRPEPGRKPEVDRHPDATEIQHVQTDGGDRRPTSEQARDARLVGEVGERDEEHCGDRHPNG